MSLAEVMMALCLLATVSLGAVSILPNAFAMERRAEGQEWATATAALLLGQCRDRAPGQLQSSQGSIRMGNGPDCQYTIGVSTSDLSSVEDVVVTVQCAQLSVVLETRIFGAAGLRGQQ
jgi:hypothetical protein